MDYSIIEFGVYGFFAYGNVLILMLTMIIDVPKTRALTLARSMYAIPGIFSAVILSGQGVNIVFPTTITNSTTSLYNATTNTIITNSTTITTEGVKNLLVNPIWIYFHGLLAAILIVFVIFQILQLLTSKD